MSHYVRASICLTLRSPKLPIGVGTITSDPRYDGASPISIVLSSGLLKMLLLPVVADENDDDAVLLAKNRAVGVVGRGQGMKVEVDLSILGLSRNR